MIRQIEELSLNAWPALQTILVDGWVIRFADGFTRRANCVNPLYSSSLSTTDLDKKIRQCEALYSARGLPTVFKLTQAVFPDDLDSLLAERGYALDAPTSVQTLSLDQRDQRVVTEVGEVRLTHALEDGWLNDFCRLSSRSSTHKPLLNQLLSRIAVPVCYAAVTVDGETLAMGMGVLERGYLGLYDIVTAEGHRRQGLGTVLVNSLLNWGKDHGAIIAYLQVMADNEPALHLYNKLGFRESYPYWYRVKPPA